jgi:hypothetical protein
MTCTVTATKNGSQTVVTTLPTAAIA